MTFATNCRAAFPLHLEELKRKTGMVHKWEKAPLQLKKRDIKDEATAICQPSGGRKISGF